MYNIFHINELNLDKIIYLTPKKQENSIFIPIMYESQTNIPLLFQLPSIKLNDSYKQDKDILIIPLNTINTSKTETIKTVLNNIDEKFILDFKNRGKKWCKEIANNMKNIEYKTLVNEIVDDEEVYDNGVLNLQLSNNIKNIKIYNEKKELLDIEQYEYALRKGNIIQSILELKGLMINLSETNEIYPVVKIHQIRYVEEKQIDVNLNLYSFLESEMEPNIQQINNKSHVIKHTEKTSASEISVSKSSNNDSSDSESSNSDTIESETISLDESDILRKINNNDTSSDESSLELDEEYIKPVKHH